MRFGQDLRRQVLRFFYKRAKKKAVFLLSYAREKGAKRAGFYYKSMTIFFKFLYKWPL